MRRISVSMCLLALLFFGVTQAGAAQRSTFVVLPFSIEGPQEFSTLERSIPQMLTSRLYWKDRVETGQEVPSKQSPVRTEQEATKAHTTYKADYVVWGTVTVVGSTFSLDVRVRDKAGKVWTQSREGNTNQIIGSVSSVSDSLNKEVFGRTPTKRVATGQGGIERVNQMNPDLVINEDRPKEVYLNPQFRYSGSSETDDSRMRSQALPFNSIGMEICDADGDGKNEIFLLTDTRVLAYRFEGASLTPIGEFDLPKANQALSIRSLQRTSGRTWIIVNTIDKKLLPSAVILTHANDSFQEEARNIKFFLNVVKLPPHYRPILIGQQPQPPKLFRQGVYEMNMVDGKLTPGARVNLPDAANVLNFAFVPSNSGDDGGDKVVVLTESENLRTYTAKGSRLAETEERYSGAAIGIEVGSAMPGLNTDKVTINSQYYVPMRILPIDLERDGKFKILVNKPTSTASTIFDRYRFFPQSEIQCLFWDGIGLNLQWKTRRIKGSTVDYTIADANNDGIVDLVVCLNTHPGSIGVKARRTIVTLYPMDTTLTNPATEPYTGDIYD